MDRELLIEIGTEELPAGWLPGLTTAIADTLQARLKDVRLTIDGPVEGFSTPRRLTARVARVAERQSDLEEVITGPPVSAAFGKDGQPTPAAVGFAKKQGVELNALERLDVPEKKGVYLAVRKQHRGRAAVDVLPHVLTALLRGLTFPRQMRWDATLNDGRGELLFGRPIRWILFLYGGRVVPFTIFRTESAQGPLVQEVRSGAVTFGHRFLTTSGRPGRAVKVKGFDDYRKRLAENFVVLDHSERRDRIAREADVEARRRGGRVATALVGQSLLQEVPDLVEYPQVVSGAIASEFLALPEEVLATTMIHHQHFYPVINDQGRLMPVFLAVINSEPEKPELIVRNLERVLAARLRDARFFWDADRQAPLEAKLERLDTVVFHKKLGSYRAKADRLATLARFIAAEVLGQDEAVAAHAQRAGLMCKADLATDMVREMTELQGAMGGIYAREGGEPEMVWKAIYHHYLPVAVDAASPPSHDQLGKAAVTWAAVSLADKLDTVVGMFAAGERPTGSRDPYGLRRAAQGLMRTLIDLPALTGLDLRLALGPMLRAAMAGFEGTSGEAGHELGLSLWPFLTERLRFVLEQRGYDVRNVRAVTHGSLLDLSPLMAMRKLETLPEFTDSPEFRQLAVLFKRVGNILRTAPSDAGDPNRTRPLLRDTLVDPAERALYDEIDKRRPVIESAVTSGNGFRQAFAEAAAFGPSVARFFDEVLVMAEDPVLKDARLRLLSRLEQLILQLADVSELVPQLES
jgi:glycyl-tRNA synthetase beta chain